MPTWIGSREAELTAPLEGSESCRPHALLIKDYVYIAFGSKPAAIFLVFIHLNCRDSLRL